MVRYKITMQPASRNTLRHKTDGTEARVERMTKSGEWQSVGYGFSFATPGLALGRAVRHVRWLRRNGYLSQRDFLADYSF